MPHPQNIDTRAMGVSARTDWIQLDIPGPEDGQTVELDSDADFDYEIINYRHKTDVGDVDVTLQIDGNPVEMNGANSDESLPADAGALDEFTPSSTNEGNYIVYEGQTLAIAFGNSSTDLANYRAKCTIRRLEKNIVVSE